uniref:Glycosyl hydrolases family 32 C terminal n=1 Tax=Candidatus Kentrum eta TaxID=2126337 RepID=A0A450V5X5_9GAMM|nr:MAG: Glycosyl hydrolases family 32 C terminal [Candidatus Kentron sp. H]VFJ93373.1 MAG: Glycosyl hydrolases family 32 C terminal [Candidatus Kentron sp. H]VFK00180.1 MAG: Glycosyl hydrolases family 32 C terminal [Candidatus Kentron sp. H]
MNNWLYAQEIPTAPWRSAMSIPREVSLKVEENGLYLAQAPVRELRELRKDPVEMDASVIKAGEKILEPIHGDRIELEATFETGSAKRLAIIVHRAHDRTNSRGVDGNGGSGTVIGYDATRGELFVDRRGAGRMDFDPDFSMLGRASAPLDAPGGRVKMHLFVDRSSVEVFGNDGRQVITTRVFPRAENRGVALFAEGGDARLVSLRAWKPDAIWEQAGERAKAAEETSVEKTNQFGGM